MTPHNIWYANGQVITKHTIPVSDAAPYNRHDSEQEGRLLGVECVAVGNGGNGRQSVWYVTIKGDEKDNHNRIVKWWCRVFKGADYYPIISAKAVNHIIRLEQPWPS